MIEDLTILIQGKLTEEALNFYKNNYYGYKTIISTWVDTPINIGIISSFWHIIRSNKPANSGPQNLYLQVSSTLKGLDMVKTKYVLKIRGDEYVSNIEYIYHEIIKNEEKIYTLPIFFRPWNVFAYHISDHLIAGKTENLKTMFVAAEKYKNPSDCPEITLGHGYLMEKEVCQNNHRDKLLMRKHYSILKLKQLRPYLLIANTFNARYESNFNPHRNQSIIRIEDL